MKTAILVHGRFELNEQISDKIPSPSNAHWFPWLQKQLLKNGIISQAPEFPTPHAPKYEQWCEMLERNPINENTILVGHSQGGGFLVRYLSENNVKVGAVVLVAPWLDVENEYEPEFFDFAIDRNLSQKTGKLVVFASDNDAPEIPSSIAKLRELIENLSVREFHDYGHFTLKSMGTDAFPELFAEVTT